MLLKGEKSTLSMMAREGQLTCIVGGSRWLQAIMGFEDVLAGFISIDGEPLLPETAVALRRLMAFVPDRLQSVGTINTYEAPTAHDVFALMANRKQNKASDIDTALKSEMERTGTNGQKARLLATSGLLKRNILLVDNPDAASLAYLKSQASAGRIVIVASTDSNVVNAADNIVETWLMSDK